MKNFNRLPQELCFTANTAGSTVNLYYNQSPFSVSLEKSTDGVNRTTYNRGTTITLTNVGDKVYLRNTSDTTTKFSTDNTNYHFFKMTGSINASGDVTSLINKNCTDTLLYNYCFKSLFVNCTSLRTAPKLPATTLTNYCYNGMFSGCSNLTTAPSLPATTLGTYCYVQMFNNCSNLEELPKLPATTLTNYCYQQMFYKCSKIKISTTQTGEYQTEYRIPTSGTGTAGTNSLQNMFASTGGTFTGTPSINTTYYTSNTLV